MRETADSQDSVLKMIDMRTLVPLHISEQQGPSYLLIFPQRHSRLDQLTTLTPTPISHATP